MYYKGLLAMGVALVTMGAASALISGRSKVDKKGQKEVKENLQAKDMPEMNNDSGELSESPIEVPQEVPNSDTHDVVDSGVINDPGGDDE